MVASCQPRGLAGQEEREPTHDFPKAGAAGSSIMVMGQEPCIAEAFLPFVQYEGCEGKQLAQQPLLGKPLLQPSSLLPALHQGATTGGKLEQERALSFERETGASIWFSGVS